MDKYFSKMEIIIHKILYFFIKFCAILNLQGCKKENPDYTCIYGLINDKTEELTLKGNHKKIIIDDVEIEIQIGYLFLKNIFGDNLEIILDFLKKTIDKY